MMYYNAPFGIIWMLFPLALIAFAVVAIVRYAVQPDRRPHGTNTALDILKERYAKGEINKQEFEEKKEDIVGEIISKKGGDHYE